MLGRGKRVSSTYGCAAVIGLLLLSGPALAQPADEATLAAARKLGQDGVTLYEHGDFAAASDRLEHAYAVVHVPTLGLWAGRALEQLGKWVEASQRYREVALIAIKATDPEVFRTAQTDAKQAYDALAVRIPELTVLLVGTTPSEVSATLDGKAVPSALLGYAQPINPGTHTLQGRRGPDVERQTVTLREGEKRAVTLSFGAVPTPKQVAAMQSPPADPHDPASASTSHAPQTDAAITDAASSKPVTKQWWFWTGLGAVVVGGTAVALAVALGGDGGTAPPLQGSAGSLRGP